MVDPVVHRIETILRDWRIYPPIAALLLAGPPLGIAVGLWLGLLQPILSSQLLFSLLMIGLVLFIIIHLGAGLILAERKISAYAQDRMGPNRVGFWGLLQPVADGVKFLLKEDVVPGHVDKPLFILAPCIAFIVAMCGFAVIPWAGEITWPWKAADGSPITVTTLAAPLDIGVLYMLAFGAMSVYGVVLAGWASNNKYAFYGGMRATAQMLSYEIPLGLGILTVLMVASSVRLEEIVNIQAQTGIWNIFIHPIAFLLVLIAGFAETNRAPFDLAECEQELIAGYHTEYSSMKFALFFLAEYSHMVIGSALLIALFGGGWHLWFLPGVDNTTWWAALLKFHVYWAKIVLVLGFYMMIRWTIPRFRFDQLMRLAWQGMIPLGMAMVTIQAVAMALGWRVRPEAPWHLNLLNAAIMFALNMAALVVVLWLTARTTTPVTGRQENLPQVRVAQSAARGNPAPAAG